MKREIIEIKEGVSAFAVPDRERAVRYELIPGAGYELYRRAENIAETGMLIYPASWGIERISADIEVVKTDQGQPEIL